MFAKSFVQRAATRLPSLTNAARMNGIRATSVRFNSSYNTHVAGLTDEQNEFRTAVQKFVDEELTPRAQQIDRDNAFPM
ncbi:hypothetical protein BGZ76_009415, partial [Entomortierella beljakovae]